MVSIKDVAIKLLDSWGVDENLLSKFKNSSYCKVEIIDTSEETTVLAWYSEVHLIYFNFRKNV